MRQILTGLLGILSLSFSAQYFQGSSQVFDVSPALSSGNVYTHELADFNGDNFIDVIYAGGAPNDSSEIWYNDGVGNFSFGSKVGSGNVLTYFNYPFDADGDGDMDFVELNDTQLNKLYINDGSGNFTFAQDLGGDVFSYTGRAISEDFDGDSDVDIAILTAGFEVEIFKNNGSGVFTSHQSIPIAHDAYAINAGSFDADGDIDLFVGGGNSVGVAGSGTILLNDGNGNFGPSGQTLSGDYNWDSEVVDIDGDFDLDILSATYAGGVQIWENNGFGVFTAGSIIGTDGSFSLEVYDLNNDTYPDIMSAASSLGAEIYWNDGSGNFTLNTTQSFPNTRSIRSDDLNGDGLPDLFTTSNLGSTPGVYFQGGCAPFNDVQEVCLVTVDSALADHNVVVWEKDAQVLPLLDSFFIYREVTTNTYQKIGAVHADSLSIFPDYGANPNTTSYKYKITALDTCGEEGPNTGLFHKSIHLQYSGFGNFQWTFYEIENTANQVASYNFWRDDLGNGNWQILQVVSGSSSSFTDVDYASYPNAIYRVDLNWIGGYICSPTKANINTSRSNKKSQASGTGSEVIETLSKIVKVYPQPANEIIYMNVPETLIGHEMSLLDASGRLLFRENINNETMTIQLAELSAGIYFIQIETIYGRVSKKVLKTE